MLQVSKVQIKLKVNGETYQREVEPRMTLLDFLRNELNLTGTKEGCGEGDCGACTVVVDGAAVNSCIMLAVEAQGRDVLTIEGVAQDGELHPLQKAFIELGAIQCGFCTPGMILSAKTFLETNPSPTEAEVRTAIAGNLCRCTGYDKIVKSILSVAGSA
jgi:carbon-monoxide dehydrogenase small subunit